MRWFNAKKLALFAGILCWSGNLLADDAYTEYYNNSSLDRTTASSFAVQAGRVAGAARVCGQDVSIFLNRINQALDKIAFSSADKVLASANFQYALRQAQDIQMNNPIPCDQVMQAYYSLPLMRDDYEETVMQKINPNSGQANPVYSQPPPAPIPSSIGDNPPPNIITLAPAGVPPPPPSPVDTNAPNIIYQAPSIGPFVDTTRPAPNINDLAPNPWTNEYPPTPISNPYANPTPP